MRSSSRACWAGAATGSRCNSARRHARSRPDSRAGCERCCLRAIAQAQLLQHMPYVRLDCRLAPHEPLGDLAFAQAGADELEDLALAQRELAVARVGRG